MRISDWSSDVCSSDLGRSGVQILEPRVRDRDRGGAVRDPVFAHADAARAGAPVEPAMTRAIAVNGLLPLLAPATLVTLAWLVRSEDHTSELHAQMRTSYALFCLTKTNHVIHPQ